MRFLLLTLSAGLLWAQDSGQAPGFRGSVVEAGVNHGVADVEISVYFRSRVVGAPERGALAGKTNTDSQGVFHIQLQNFGDYFVTATKDGYTAVGGSPSQAPSTSAEAILSKDHPRREVQFVVGRPGEVAG